MSEDRTFLGKPLDFEPDAKRDGYHCEDCAATAGYGIFHFDTVDEARRKHQQKYGWTDRKKG